MDQTEQTRTSSRKVAFIQARWHAGIVDRCREAFVGEIARLTNTATEVAVFDAPGAFEIPLLARRLAESGDYAAVVGGAFVVDGGIYRHDFVAQTVVAALMEAQMATGVPVLSAVLTPHSYQETPAHDAFFAEHFRVKGREAAQACIEILATHAQLATA